MAIRVLLVGFDRAAAERLATFLAQAGHRAYPAGDAREAAAVVGAAGVQLALADLEGPFKEVLGALEAARAGGRPRCPVFGVGSVEAGSAIGERLGALGLDGVIPPSVTPQELIFRVNAALYPERSPALRASRRVPVDLPATLESPDRQLEGRVLNLSETGLFLAVERPAAVDDRVRVAFAAGGPPIVVRCRVAWTSPDRDGRRYFPGMGLEFLDLSPASLAALRVFLARALADLAPPGEAARERDR